MNGRCKNTQEINLSLMRSYMLIAWKHNDKWSSKYFSKLRASCKLSKEKHQLLIIILRFQWSREFRRTNFQCKVLNRRSREKKHNRPRGTWNVRFMRNTCWAVNKYYIITEILKRMLFKELWRAPYNDKLNWGFTALGAILVSGSNPCLAMMAI